MSYLYFTQGGARFLIGGDLRPRGAPPTCLKPTPEVLGCILGPILIAKSVLSGESTPEVEGRALALRAMYPRTGWR